MSNNDEGGNLRFEVIQGVVVANFSNLLWKEIISRLFNRNWRHGMKEPNNLDDIVSEKFIILLFYVEQIANISWYKIILTLIGNDVVYEIAPIHTKIMFQNINSKRTYSISENAEPYALTPMNELIYFLWGNKLLEFHIISIIICIYQRQWIGY